MANKDKAVAVDSLAVDCTALASILVDLPPGGQKGFQATQAGYGEVVEEILGNQPRYGERAGVTRQDILRITTADSNIESIDAELSKARKIVEILEESRAKYDDQRQRHVYAVAIAVERRARANSDTELLAKYEKTRAYRSAIGIKAAKTRRKNASAKDQQASAK